MNRDELINAVEVCARERGIAPATVTSRAVGNSRLYERLLQGGDCTTTTAERLMKYIATVNSQSRQTSEDAA